MPLLLHLLHLLHLLTSIFLPSSTTAAAADRTICPSTACGPIHVKYPFWLHNDGAAAAATDSFCGYVEFGISCSRDGAVLSISGESYYVKSIDYEGRTLTLADADVAHQPCPRALHNLTLNDDVPLAFSARDTNLSFYFNCTSYPKFLQPLECLGQRGRAVSVIGFGSGGEGFEWVGRCEAKVVAPVAVATEVLEGRGLAREFGEALKGGFELEWRTSRECFGCEASNGLCGYKSAAEEVLCFCSDGKVRKGHCKGKGDKLKLVIIGIAVTVAGILLFVVICLRRGFSFSMAKLVSRKSPIDQEKVEAFVKNHESLGPKRYSYANVKRMTNSFHIKLGQGGYGSVFKGRLLNGESVAVKVLSTSKGSGEEFINEVASISKTSHVNIVTLVGFCFEGRRQALIYEYMPNGSLEKFIYNDDPSNASQHLGWEKLYHIAHGVARGLEYLHRGCKTRILHFDIKPHNILLDENFCPKITDFGLSKLCRPKESMVSMMEARGTLGYIAPEVFNRNFGGVSYKSDVYSFGMLLLEMVGGRKNLDPGVEHMSEIYFPQWVYKSLQLNLDLGLRNIVSEGDMEIVKKLLVVGLWCIQSNPSHRPAMGEVIDMLEGEIKELKFPPNPFFSSPPTPAR